jgi:hypothetical protein
LPKFQNINKDLYENEFITIIFVMPKSPLALSQMPPATLSALQQLGADLAVARLRRKESLAVWALRMGTSVPTLMRMEAGEPGVSMGIYATALWLVGRSGALAVLAAPEADRGALELDVRAAVTLGKERRNASKASQISKGLKKEGAVKKGIADA